MKTGTSDLENRAIQFFQIEHIKNKTYTMDLKYLTNIHLDKNKMTLNINRISIIKVQILITSLNTKFSHITVGSNTYYKPQHKVFTHYSLFSSPLEIKNKKYIGVLSRQNRMLWFAKLDSPVFPDRTEWKNRELGVQALIDLSPPLSLTTKKMSGSSCRGLMLCLHLLLCSLLLCHKYKPEEGSQMEEGEMRMHRPHNHSQIRTH
jgi:hypothetical protein